MPWPRANMGLRYIYVLLWVYKKKYKKNIWKKTVVIYNVFKKKTIKIILEKKHKKMKGKKTT